MTVVVPVFTCIRKHVFILGRYNLVILYILFVCKNEVKDIIGFGIPTDIRVPTHALTE